MTYSCLFLKQDQIEAPRNAEVPVYFKDLNLSTIFAPIIKDKADLAELFYTPLQEKSEIIYRQEIFQDLDKLELRKSFTNFSDNLLTIAKVLQGFADRDYEDAPYLTEGRLLAAAENYCQQVEELKTCLTTAKSTGLQNLQIYLADYVSSQAFISLKEAAAKLRETFSQLHYILHIRRATLTVQKYEGEANLSNQVLASFERFRQDKVKDYRLKIHDGPYAEHIEEAILRLLKSLYPEAFKSLGEFYQSFNHFVDDTLLKLAREIRFYLSWLELIEIPQKAGLNFCYPELSARASEIESLVSFDLALALKKGEVVTNDFTLNMPERIMTITGPNQGGKTTFARTFGQVHYLAALGLPVPGIRASLTLFDNIYTHFAREEDSTSTNGKLQDDLLRLHEIFQKATPDSLVIVNEIFNSTTVEDAAILGKKMMEFLIELGCPAVIVTFLDELTVMGPAVVSIMSTVNKTDSLERTFKIVRKDADGLAFALDIARKYHLTYGQLQKRLAE